MITIIITYTKKSIYPITNTKIQLHKLHFNLKNIYDTGPAAI